jgi:putative flippase GtrA
MAAIVGITVSYIGNRSQVFRSGAPHSVTLPRFLAIYACVAVIHAGSLALWTDIMHRPYQAGFVIATGLSVVLTYLANRLYVFR